jgi:hypothetical protein
MVAEDMNGECERDQRAGAAPGWDGTADGLLIYLRRCGVFAHHVTLAENGDFLASFDRRVGSAAECEHLLLVLEGIGVTERISDGIIRAVPAANLPGPGARRPEKRFRRARVIRRTS